MEGYTFFSFVAVFSDFSYLFFPISPYFFSIFFPIICDASEHRVAG